MFQVIKMCGSIEPWWFLEDWKNDIVTVKEFDNYYQALKYYKKEWLLLQKNYPYFTSKGSIMASFWDASERNWCEECMEMLQNYHSIALLSDWKELPLRLHRPGYRKTNTRPHMRTCLIKK